MSPSIITKATSFGFAVLVTLAIVTSLDGLARSEQAQALAAGGVMTQTACLAPARAANS